MHYITVKAGQFTPRIHSHVASLLSTRFHFFLLEQWFYFKTPLNGNDALPQLFHRSKFIVINDDSPSFVSNTYITSFRMYLHKCVRHILLADPTLELPTMDYKNDKNQPRRNAIRGKISRVYVLRKINLLTFFYFLNKP